MKSLFDIIDRNRVYTQLTQNEHKQIVDFYYVHLNKERERQRELNFKKFWGANTELDRDQAYDKFKKMKGKDGFLPKLSPAYISMCVSASKMSLDDLYQVEKQAKTVSLTQLFPWLRKA